MSTILSTLARQRAEEFRAGLAQFNGVADTAQWFSVDPARAQEVTLLMQQEAQPFLGLVSVLPKPEKSGDVIYIGADDFAASRTNTNLEGHERTPRTVHGKYKNTYDMSPVEIDVAIKYSELDSWAMFPNMYDLWAAKVRLTQANSILKVGWYGESAASESDINTNTNGEDVLPGWLHLIRSNATTIGDLPGIAQYVDGSGGAVVLGSGNADGFPNLDYLVSTAQTRLDIVYRYAPDLVALIGPDLVAHEQNMMWFKNGRKPENKSLLNSDGTLTKNFGGLPSYSPPFFPTGTVLITALSNLHHYYQPTSVRRLVRDWAPKNQYEDFNSANRCYAIGDYRKCSLVDGITIDENQPLP